MLTIPPPPDDPTLLDALKQRKPQLLWQTLPADIHTPVGVLMRLQTMSSYHALFESVEGGETRARYSMIVLDPDILWQCEGGQASICRDVGTEEFIPEAGHPFESLRALIQESHFPLPDGVPPMAAGLFGYMGYDMVKLMERLPEENPDTIGIPRAVYMRPRLIIVFDNIKDTMTLFTSIWPGSEEASEALRRAKERLNEAQSALSAPLSMNVQADGTPVVPELDFTSHIAQADFEAMVEKAKEYIVAGDIFQVVPSRRLSAPFRLPALSLYRALRSLNPSPYMFYVQMKDFTLVGASPEILVRVVQDTVTIRPIAGTRPRGRTPEEDAALALELRADGKELAEHLMLLDLGRNDTGRVAQPASVKVTEEMIIERYSHVMHIVSNVEGRLASGKDALDALIAGFPAGTVSGAPKIRAMEIIEELEPEARSFYAGTVGYFSAGGGMDTCIALRTALVKDQTLYLQAGGGVVADSNPEAEFIETENKARALIHAAEQAARFVV